MCGQDINLKTICWRQRLNVHCLPTPHSSLQLSSLFYHTPQLYSVTPSAEDNSPAGLPLSQRMYVLEPLRKSTVSLSRLIPTNTRLTAMSHSLDTRKPLKDCIVRKCWYRNSIMVCIDFFAFQNNCPIKDFYQTVVR